MWERALSTFGILFGLTLIGGVAAVYWFVWAIGSGIAGGNGSDWFLTAVSTILVCGAAWLVLRMPARPRKIAILALVAVSIASAPTLYVPLFTVPTLVMMFAIHIIKQELA